MSDYKTDKLKPFPHPNLEFNNLSSHSGEDEGLTRSSNKIDTESSSARIQTANAIITSFLRFSHSYHIDDIYFFPFSFSRVLYQSYTITVRY